MILPNQAETLDEFLAHGPYVGYCYSYPHKTAYRPLEHPLTWKQAWQNENQANLFLYAHIPFCEMRCGFCNLFTFSQPDSEIPSRYLAQLKRQSQLILDQLDNPSFQQVAIGGGTPTFLNQWELEMLLETLNNMGVDSRSAISMEASPATITGDKLSLLKDFGVSRISMGIQSFDRQDTGQLGRPQQVSKVAEAIELIQRQQFPIFNLDLIYGAAGQTMNSWLQSVSRLIEIQPTEAFLYPLYVRPLTGLGKRSTTQATDLRLEMYRAARDQLLSAGYRQISMRMFEHVEQKIGLPSCSSNYVCQRDGMIGLGVGARSYTNHLHYSSRFAVEQKSIAKIINDYVSLDDQGLVSVKYGRQLDESERARRFVILSLLNSEGLDIPLFREMFGDSPLSRFPELDELSQRGFMTTSATRIRPTQRGLELSDAIGPWLYSDTVRKLMKEYEWAHC